VEVVEAQPRLQQIPQPRRPLQHLKFVRLAVARRAQAARHSIDRRRSPQVPPGPEQGPALD
jgi:hypothetical protein